jgi:hypothetical protein
MSTYPPTPPTPIGPNKTIAATIAGAGIVIASWAISAAFPHVTVPPEVWAAAQTIIVSALVYYVPHGG